MYEIEIRAIRMKYRSTQPPAYLAGGCVVLGMNSSRTHFRSVLQNINNIIQAKDAVSPSIIRKDLVFLSQFITWLRTPASLVVG